MYLLDEMEKQMSFPNLRIVQNFPHSNYEVYDMYDGTGWFTGTYTECLDFIDQFYGV